MTTLNPLKLKCPICETDFESSSVGSCGYASKRTDFRPNYWGLNPVEYFFHDCPHCGFCSDENYFNSKIENPELRKKIIKIGPLKEYSLEKKLERAMHCLELLINYNLRDTDEFGLANNWIQVFWWAASHVSELKFGKIVLDYFEKAFHKNLIPEKQIPTIKYLMGEINRRIGQKNKANEFFDEVISITKHKNELQDIHDLAVQQKTNPKENI